MDEVKNNEYIPSEDRRLTSRSASCTQTRNIHVFCMDQPAEAQATDIYKGSLLLFLIFTLGGTYLLRWAPFAL